MYWREMVMGATLVVLLCWAGPCAVRCGWETGGVLHENVAEDK